MASQDLSVQGNGLVFLEVFGRTKLHGLVTRGEEGKIRGGEIEKRDRVGEREINLEVEEEGDVGKGKERERQEIML